MNFPEAIKKLLCLKKSAHVVLMASLEKAIWNWMDTYPHEFADVQVSGKDKKVILHQDVP